MGNVRTSYTRNPETGSAEVLDRNDYYPFGMNMQGYSSAFDSAGGVYNNKYNQKELQETGFYDYGWRHYMPDLGRWFGMDKLSEKFHSASPYAYVMNNPISFFDPDGMHMQMPDCLKGLWTGTTKESYWTSNGSGGFNGGEVKNPMTQAQYSSFFNFLSSGKTGTFTYTTFAAGGNVGSHNSTGMDIDMSGVDFHNITITDNGFWNDVMDKTANFFKEHFYAEGTVAAKHGMYASVILKNGLGLTLGEYSENRITYSTDNIHHLKFSDTRKFEASAAFEAGGGYSYDIENNTNQITVGAYTFGAEITKNNIFVGWTPNINLGIGVGGEAGLKIGFNLPTNGWFDYDNW